MRRLVHQRNVRYQRTMATPCDSSVGTRSALLTVLGGIEMKRQLTIFGSAVLFFTLSASGQEPLRRG
ncbi:MAG TPA: hypothetical protein VNY05_40520, partial [Candidatus Acidoferrales bacterium]|nr:hypothetical protein [Candidatus Acidoferrales bacterium]